MEKKRVAKFFLKDSGNMVQANWFRSLAYPGMIKKAVNIREGPVSKMCTSTGGRLAGKGTGGQRC
jgi:hypothetical protein